MEDCLPPLDVLGAASVTQSESNPSNMAAAATVSHIVADG
jgi:hypothetical protein